MTQIYPIARAGRMRNNPILRRYGEMEIPGPQKFIWPVFIKEGVNLKEPIPALPGQFYYSVDRVCEDITKVVEQGVKSILVFSVVSDDKKDKDGTESYNEEGVAQRAVREIRNKFPEVVLFADVGLTGYTTSGSAQVFDSQGNFDNDLSIESIKKISLSFARAGVTGVAPSGMIDGQVKELRKCLDDNGYKRVIILSYSTKINSNCMRTFPYGNSSKKQVELDRGAYLTSYLDKRTAVRESLIDEEEGADILMVKPAILYLDILSEVKSRTSIPIAAYNVSGEYSMMAGMIEKGYAELKGLVKETLCAINRAGADIIISYWANQYDKIFKS